MLSIMTKNSTQTHINSTLIGTLVISLTFFRFSSEEKAKRDALTFLPFGYGPRNCIGMRFALIEIWLTLTYLLKDYKIVEVPGSPVSC